MKNAVTSSLIPIGIVVAIVSMVNSFIFLALPTFATSTLSDSIQESQNQLQSKINSQVQTSITDTINSINNGSTSSSNKTTDSSNSTKDHISFSMANNSSNSVIRGGITSLQIDSADSTVTWILSGVYNIYNLTSPSPQFNAFFSMTKTDGNSSHSHYIYDSKLKKLSDSRSNNNSTVLTGTTTVAMREGQDVDVPTNITLFGDTVIKIWLDPYVVNNHFGNSPIYGTQDFKCLEIPSYCK